MSESIYLSVKHAQTEKAGKHSKGKISYRVLTDELHEELFITIVGNEGGQLFNDVFAKKWSTFRRCFTVLIEFLWNIPLPMSPSQTATSRPLFSLVKQPNQNPHSLQKGWGVFSFGACGKICTLKTLKENK